MKVLAVVLILAGLSAVAAGLASGPSAHLTDGSVLTQLPKVSMRELGALPPSSGEGTKAAAAEKPSKPSTVAMADKPAAAPTTGTDRLALDRALKETGEKPDESGDKPAAAPEKTSEKSEKNEKADKSTELAAPTTAEKPAPPPPPPARPTPARPAPHPVAGPSESSAPPAASPPAAAAAGEADTGAPMGALNLRASDTADVFVDGKKVGTSPQMGFKVKAGKHKVRFDCYGGSGETKPGTTSTADVPANGEKDVEYECPTE